MRCQNDTLDLRAWLVNRVGNSRLLRVALHLVCLLHRPAHLRWHCRGVARELFETAPSS